MEGIKYCFFRTLVKKLKEDTLPPTWSTPLRLECTHVIRRGSVSTSARLEPSGFSMTLLCRKPSWSFPTWSTVNTHSQKFAQWLRKLIVLTTESRALLTTHTQPKIKDHLKKSSIYRGYVITIHSQLKKRSKFGELWNRRKGHSEYYSSNKKGHSIWTFYSIAPITSENYQLFTFRFGFGELSGQGEYTPFCWNEVSQ